MTTQRKMASLVQMNQNQSVKTKSNRRLSVTTQLKSILSLSPKSHLHKGAFDKTNNKFRYEYDDESRSQKSNDKEESQDRDSKLEMNALFPDKDQNEKYVKRDRDNLAIDDELNDNRLQPMVFTHQKLKKILERFDELRMDCKDGTIFKHTDVYTVWEALSRSCEGIEVHLAKGTCNQIQSDAVELIKSTIKRLRTFMNRIQRNEGKWVDKNDNQILTVNINRKRSRQEFSALDINQSQLSISNKRHKRGNIADDFNINDSSKLTDEDRDLTITEQMPLNVNRGHTANNGTSVLIDGYEDLFGSYANTK